MKLGCIKLFFLWLIGQIKKDKVISVCRVGRLVFAQREGQVWVNDGVRFDVLPILPGESRLGTANRAARAMESLPCATVVYGSFTLTLNMAGFLTIAQEGHNFIVIDKSGIVMNNLYQVLSTIVDCQLPVDLSDAEEVVEKFVLRQNGHRLWGHMSGHYKGCEAIIR